VCLPPCCLYCRFVKAPLALAGFLIVIDKGKGRKRRVLPEIYLERSSSWHLVPGGYYYSHLPTKLQQQYQVTIYNMTTEFISPSQVNDFDYVIVGGGTAGCVIASRLSEYLPHKKILLVEAGPSDFNNDKVLKLKEWLTLLGGELDYDYGTTEQPNGRRRTGLPLVWMLIEH
jgi:hypothetical protein